LFFRIKQRRLSKQLKIRINLKVFIQVFNSQAVLETDIKSDKKQKLKVLYGSQTGTAKHWANKLASSAKEHNFDVTIHDLATYEPDNLSEASIVLFVISTYTDGSPPDSCLPFYTWLEDFTNDFRVTKTHYQQVKYAVFGIGNSIYGKQFNTVAKNIDNMVKSLSATRIIPVGLGDNGAGVEVAESYLPWESKLFEKLKSMESQDIKSDVSTLSPSVSEKKKSRVSDEADEDDDDNETTEEPLIDMEDLGKVFEISFYEY
jgi:tRNA wybutosine-synthesizing protein 1